MLRQHSSLAGGDGTEPIWLCFCAGDILLRREGAEGVFSLPIGNEPPVKLQPWNTITRLSPLPHRKGGSEAIVVRLDEPVTGVDGLQMVGLRKTYTILSEQDYLLAGKAAELIYWDSNTKYCGCCGSPTRWMTAISKQCTECGKEWWPSVSTAIIVRVVRNLSRAPLPRERERDLRDSSLRQAEDSPLCISKENGDEAILLVHARNFRGNHYGLVAGFLETGESLEECVKREVREETGIKIRNLRYFDSQPWPYPFGLMVGFTADYDSGELHLQKAELSEGGWFTRDNMPSIPDRASIARRLIDDWLGNGG